MSVLLFIGSFSEYGVSGLLQASTYVFFGYVGFEAISTTAQDAAKPEKSLPISTIGSTIITMLLYVAISTVLVGLVPYKLLDASSPLTEAM